MVVEKRLDAFDQANTSQAEVSGHTEVFGQADQASAQVSSCQTSVQLNMSHQTETQEPETK